VGLFIANWILANSESAFGNWQSAMVWPTRYRVVVLTSSGPHLIAIQMGKLNQYLMLTLLCVLRHSVV